MPERYYRDVLAAERDLNDRKEEYVQRWGWRRTCNTPGSFWLWVRDFRKEDNERVDNWRDRGGSSTRPKPYGVMTVPLDMAVRMTVMSLDEQPEETEDEDDG